MSLKILKLFQGKANWPTFSSVGLRNELRPSLTLASTLQPYTWSTWKQYMTAAASAVHAANPDVLIFFSGLDSDFNIEPAVGGSTLLDPGFSFSVAEYEWAGNLSSKCTSTTKVSLHHAPCMKRSWTLLVPMLPRKVGLAQIEPLS